jgi:endonuclease YncB( thermonuclease family)
VLCLLITTKFLSGNDNLSCDYECSAWFYHVNYILNVTFFVVSGYMTGGWQVIEVVSGDCVVVADDAAPYGSPAAERRVNLSSIRAPKIGNPKKEERPAAYAREAKEYLRNLLIGQQVQYGCEMFLTLI